MNTKLDNNTLLTLLSKNYVIERLNIDPIDFAPTPDTAWITIAAKLLKHSPQPRATKAMGKG